MTPLFNLTPRQARTTLDLVTGAVVVSVAIALAGLTWRLAGHAGTGAITVPSGQTGPIAPPDVAPAIALVPFGKPSATEAAQATSLPLELKGVIAAVPASMSTAFISVSGAPPVTFHVGEAVNGATIQAILRDRIILGVGGRSEYLAFPDPTLSPAQRQAAQQNQATATTQPTGISSTAAPAPAAPPAASTAAVLQRFDASPVNGGYRIGDNGPPGMVPGDVIQSVNGTALSDPAAANAAFAGAQASGSAQIQILRDGKRLTLTVPLR